jgi:multimeric flavodoxin WrbA
MVRVLIISGSERSGGNTDAICRTIERQVSLAGHSAETVTVRDLEYSACGTCGDCNHRSTPCALDDDMAGVTERMEAADALVYVAPVHVFGLSSTMQRFIERTGVCHLRFRRPLTNKVALPIIVARRYGHIEVQAQLLQNCLLNRMILVGSGYPTVVHAGGRDEAGSDHEGQTAVAAAVSRMLGMAELLQNGKEKVGQHLSVARASERVDVTRP